jgi:hydroxymethylpyrimidine pyrophosphatase-like HAD family hydrolase
MTKFKILFSAASIMFAALVFGQATTVRFSSDAAIWQKTDAGNVSTFTVNASLTDLAVIKERYDALGNSVKYAVASLDENTHIITMTFDKEIGSSYLYKMLMYIGCQTVFVGDKSYDINDFNMSFLN